MPKESGVTAFFTRSSAANIPVNMALCEKLRLPEETYAVSIPLGATINMAGAAITITVLSMAAVHTLGVEIDIATAVLLSLVATISACGASGVAGGSRWRSLWHAACSASVMMWQCRWLLLVSSSAYCRILQKRH